MKKMSAKTIETARAALNSLSLYIGCYSDAATCDVNEAYTAWHKLKNFVDLAEWELEQEAEK